MQQLNRFEMYYYRTQNVSPVPVALCWDWSKCLLDGLGCQYSWTRLSSFHDSWSWMTPNILLSLCTSHMFFPYFFHSEG